MRTLYLIALAALQAVLATQSLAAPGDLDLTFAGFGTGGVKITSGETAAMAVAPDGKIVIVGHSGIQLTVRRYLPDGSLDPTFSGDGLATFLNPAYAMGASAVAVQPDGKIIVGGNAEAAHDNFLLARVNTNGTIDASFGGGGYATTDFASQGSSVSAVLVQIDGKIVAAGTATVGGDTDFAVARFSPNGLLDTSFSGDGKVTVVFGGDDECWDAVLQPDEKLVLVGGTVGDITADIAVARLNANGTLDGDFAFGGKLTIGFGDFDTAYGVALQADTKIVVVGSSAGDGVLARINPDGTLDTSLDFDGKLFVSSDHLEDVAIQPDGRILLVGQHFSLSEDHQLAVHRLEPDGDADPTFDDDGRAFFDLGVADSGRALALLPDGRILAYGTTGPDWFNQNASILVRLWQNGNLDDGGKQVLGFPESFLGPASNERIAGVVEQPDHKIVVAGEIVNAAGTESDFGVARFLPDGELDPSFGTLGCATFSFHNVDVARAVALQPDGKIVVAGFAGSGNAVNFLVVRFNSNGTLDDTFGFFGFNLLDFMGGGDYAQAVAIAPDGKIVVAGTVFNGVNNVFGVCRFTSDGIIDASFDGDGKQTREISFGAVHWATSVVVQEDLKVVVGGHVSYDFALARFRENGLFDYGWGPGGQGYSAFDLGGDEYLGALTVAVGGWFYAVGSRTLGGGTDFALAQLEPNGVLATCTEFPCQNWSTGTAFVNLGGYDAAYSVDWRPDGQVVAAGYANGLIAWAQFSTGSSSAPWLGTAGLVGEGEGALGVCFTGIDHLITVATQDYNGNQNFALAKFETSPNPWSGVGDPPALLPQLDLRLYAAYPNPVTHGAVIAFDLAQAQPVRVALYDAAGRRVRTLAEGPFGEGRHESIWDGKDDEGRSVAAGVYFVRAEAGTARAQQKLILLK